MPRFSAGLLLYRYRDNQLQVLLVHPGGPYWRGKNEGAWSIPKGEYEEREAPLAAAMREFEEETGSPAPSTHPGDFIALTPATQPSGKVVTAWAANADFDASTLHSNTFSLEWPPESGKMQDFPEADRAGWFSLSDAERHIQKGQAPLLQELADRLR